MWVGQNWLIIVQGLAGSLDLKRMHRALHMERRPGPALAACIDPKFTLFSNNYRSLEAAHMYVLGHGWSNYVDIKGASSYVIALPLNVDFVLPPRAWKDCAFKFIVQTRFNCSVTNWLYKTLIICYD